MTMNRTVELLTTAHGRTENSSTSPS